jgi:hypothetical protein
MRREERDLLPLAERCFGEADWKRLAEAFGANPDPLAGAQEDEDFRKLFSRIANLAPAPVGLGQPWQRIA